MGRTSTIGTGNPQHALSAKVATGPARKLMVTCLSISMNSGSQVSSEFVFKLLKLFHLSYAAGGFNLFITCV